MDYDLEKPLCCSMLQDAFKSGDHFVRLEDEDIERCCDTSATGGPPEFIYSESAFFNYKVGDIVIVDNEGNILTYPFSYCPFCGYNLQGGT